MSLPHSNWREEYYKQYVSSIVNDLPELEPLPRLTLDDTDDPMNYHIKRHYYPNGQIMLKVRYCGEKRHGEEVGYHPNGVEMCKFNWENDEPVGEFRFYHDNGKIDISGTLVDGLLDGMAKMYYRDGTPRAEGVFNHGLKIGKWYYWDEDGVEKIVEYLLMT